MTVILVVIMLLAKGINSSRLGIKDIGFQNFAYSFVNYKSQEIIVIMVITAKVVITIINTTKFLINGVMVQVRAVAPFIKLQY